MASPSKADTAHKLMVQEFFQGKKILVVDENSSCRSLVANVLNDLGIKISEVTLSSNYQSASDVINRIKPAILICDYDLGDYSALELINKQRKVLEAGTDTMNILIASNATQVAVAEAAEEDVDAYVLKPFTFDKVRTYVIKATANRQMVGDYRLKVNQGKRLIAAGALDEAMEIFKEAQGLHAKPALAHYYMGQVFEERKDLFSAEMEYQAGLVYNANHYRCLNALCDIQYQLDNFESAYDTALEVTRVFPLTPNRLAHFVRLAIQTKHFDDVPSYFQRFQELPYRYEEVTEVMVEALIAYGSHLLIENSEDHAMEMFKNAELISRRNPAVIRSCIEHLIETRNFPQANTMLKAFKDEDLKDNDALACELLISNETRPGHLTVEMGRRFIMDGVVDYDVYRITITRASELAMARTTEELAYQAARHFPEHRDEFFGMANTSGEDFEEGDEEDEEEEA